jgi:cytochrome b
LSGFIQAKRHLAHGFSAGSPLPIAIFYNFRRFFFDTAAKESAAGADFGTAALRVGAIRPKRLSCGGVRYYKLPAVSRWWRNRREASGAVAKDHGAEKVPLFVWDAPTRLFHWIIVALVITAWATAEADSEFAFQIHLAAGYGVLAALIFRVIWGFSGNRYTLFRNFVRPWTVVRDYVRKLAQLRPPHSTGHNPLGGWMVILLLATLAALVATGLFSAERNGTDAGPLSHFVSAATAQDLKGLHEGLFNVLLALVAVHIAGVVTDIVLTRDNLVWAMITGFKSVAPEAARADGSGTPVPSLRAVIAVAVAVTWILTSQ